MEKRQIFTCHIENPEWDITFVMLFNLIADDMPATVLLLIFYQNSEC